MSDSELRELTRERATALACFDGGALAMADVLDACATILQLVARTLRMAGLRAQAQEKHHKHD